MSLQAVTQTKGQNQTAASPSGKLQHKCACGKPIQAGGECAACRKKRLAIQRKPKKSTGNERLKKQTNYENQAHLEPRFGRDFSSIPARSPDTPPLQTMLAINEPGDQYEQEADRIAQQVMLLPSPFGVNGAPVHVQRFVRQPPGQVDMDHQSRVSNVKTRDEKIQRKTDPEPDVHGTQREPAGEFSQLTGGGLPLSHSLRAFYENRFGYDLSGVRTHTGLEADRLNNSVQARAFTYKNHVWLGSGEQLAPSFCLAHELVHTIQQNRPPRKGHRAGAVHLAKAPQSQTHGPLVQRVAVYWAPRNAPLKTGNDIQDAIFSDFSGNSNLLQEVNIPNAARKKGGEGAESGFHVKSGRADLYLADGGKRIGVRFSGEDQPQPLANRGTKRPRVSKGKMVYIEEGPQWVKIGEIKPASEKQIGWGREQVSHYLKGIKKAVDETNKWSALRGGKEWALIETDPLMPMGEGDIQLKPEYTFNPGQPITDVELVLAEFSASEKLRRRLDPRDDIGQPVMGGLYVKYYPGGVWAYYARPADPQAVVNLPGLTDEQAGHVQLAQDLQAFVVHPISGAPVEPVGLRRPRVQDPLQVNHHSKPGRIQRAPKGAPRVRDNFNLNRVKEARKKLRGRFKKQEKSKPFKRLKFLDLAYQAEEGLTQVGLAKGKPLPDKEQLALELKSGDKKTGKGTGKKTVERPLPELYRWMELWTNPAIDILAGFRKIFGNTFVTVSNKLRGFKEKFKQKLSQIFNKQAKGRASGTSYRAVAVRAIGRGLKAVADLLLPQTLRLIVESLISGAKDRLRAILPLDIGALEGAVQGEFQQFNPVIERIEALKSSVDEKLENIKENLSSFIDLGGLEKIFSLASQVASTVKWAVRAIQCGTPPGWGCLKLIFSSLTAWVADKVLQNCTLQKEVACLVTGIDFVKNEIPKSIANAVGGEFNEILGNIDPRLSPLFKKIESTSSITLNCGEIGCEGGPSELDKAYDRLEEVLVEKFGFLQASMMMDSLVELGKVFEPDERAGLSAGEVDKLRKLLLLYKVTPLELELVVDDIKRRIEEAGEARHATVEEFGEGIERYRQSLMSGGLPAGDQEETGDGGNGVQGGGGQTVPGEEGQIGEGPGVATVDIDEATFTGKQTGTVDKTRITVESPDFKKHKRGSHQVSLILTIEGVQIKRVTNVPVNVPKGGRRWVPGTNKAEMTIRYKLQKGVSFVHSVPEYQSPIVIENGVVIPMPVKNPRQAKTQPAAEE